MYIIVNVDCKIPVKTEDRGLIKTPLASFYEIVLGSVISLAYEPSSQGRGYRTALGYISVDKTPIKNGKTAP